MGFPSHIRAKYLSWSHDIPLPILDPETTANFQAWHEFDPSAQRWVQARTPRDETPASQAQEQITSRSNLVLVTWNVDATEPFPERRISAIISFICTLDPSVDIIFFQEVSRKALSSLLTNETIRKSWFSSEKSTDAWGGQSFATMTLLSKAHFACGCVGMATGRIGPVWRTTLPSRFGRDALCCDVFVPSRTSTSSPSDPSNSRVRLINVHLDSLPVQPSQRPRQLSIVSSILRSACRGLVAGDFNPVLEEDGSLLTQNGLTDAWTELRPGDPGFTWGADGDQPFPPNRLDKIGFLGLRPKHITILKTRLLERANDNDEEIERTGETAKGDQCPDGRPPWSDHYGLHCSFELVAK